MSVSTSAGKEVKYTEHVIQADNTGDSGAAEVLEDADEDRMLIQAVVGDHHTMNAQNEIEWVFGLGQPIGLDAATSPNPSTGDGQAASKGQGAVLANVGKSSFIDTASGTGAGFGSQVQVIPLYWEGVGGVHWDENETLWSWLYVGSQSANAEEQSATYYYVER